ncbi:peptidylprolyl isomerase [Euzebya tangerina]|uniref:peptidylprolyl isomerase n=1 Tax=Euzebya tangerina TaxID=591198 RepID=UPI0013C2D384|nr:peptidylprolyl isomerase [Euzebya tangerina]
MSGSQKKKAEKARRKAEREKARQEERRRNVMTGIAAGVVLLLGGIIVAVTVQGDNAEQEQLASEAAALQSEAIASASEAAASEAVDSPTDTPTEVTVDDDTVEPGTPVDSGLEPATDDRPVACGAEEPANAFDTRPQFPGGPADVLEEGVDYTAVIETSCGTITMDLLEDEAPLTVNSFVFLAEEGFFDGLEIFRNATGIGALQTGGGDQTNTWQIGYSIPDELGLARDQGYPVGAVAMANSGPNSAGSQFFFVYTDAFDQAFTGDAITFSVFGQITEGLDVAEEIGAIPVDGETPTERVYMESVTIQES